MGEYREFIGSYEKMGEGVWSIDYQWAEDGKAEEVIRCADCDSLIDCGDHYLCVMWGCPTEPDGYCHKGERRDE